MSQQLPEGHRSYVGDAKEVELQDSNDWLMHVLPLREVVTKPVTPMLPTANKCRPTQDKRSLSSCLLGNTAKKCNKIIKNKNGIRKSHMINLSFQAQFYLKGCYTWNNYYCGPESREKVVAKLQIMGSFTQWPKYKTKIYLIHKTVFQVFLVFLKNNLCLIYFQQCLKLKNWNIISFLYQYI